ncbi:MAG: class I SAM-dependent methyltransferase [Deltaproteobacteria bacterium]|nr:class I SAM-dependent methyltransferase [Deltaproteobacteria bacterium]
MSNDKESIKSPSSPGKACQPRRRFTEGLLDLDAILKALDIKAGQTILEAGCGTGYMSKIFSKEVGPSGKVYALDTDRYFLKILEQETQATNIEVVEGDITGRTGIEDASVDMIYLSTVIYSFSRYKILGFLKESGRLLKQDGLLAIVEMEKKETPFGPPLESRYSPDELKAIIPMRPLDTVQAGEHFYMQIFRNKNTE